MELQYFGGNCVRLSTKQASVVVDDNLVQLGQKSIVKPEDVVLITNASVMQAEGGGRLAISQPGEYEIANVSIQGVGAQAHVDESGTLGATIFKVVIDDIRVVVLGHIFAELSEQQLEALGIVDVLVVPVGGHGYTLDAIGALKLIKKIGPKIVVPTHYADSNLNYEVPPAELADAIKELGMEIAETAPKLKLKQADLTDVLRLVVIERQ